MRSCIHSGGRAAAIALAVNAVAIGVVPAQPAHRADMPVEFVVTNLLGSDVRTAQDETVGEVVDLVVEGGRIETVVVSLGGVLGVGNRLVGVPYSDFRKGDAVDSYVVAGSLSGLSKLAEFEPPRDLVAVSGSQANRPQQEPQSLPAESPQPLKIDPELAEIDPRLAEGIASNEAAFGEQLDHESYDNDSDKDADVVGDDNPQR